MAYYNVCRYCGCNLDPGEKCDCEREKMIERQEMERRITISSFGQYELKFLLEGVQA